MKNKNTLFLTQLALLVAVALVLAYTPLGYLNIGPLAVSFMMVPVALGAVLLGPVGGAVLGTVFGLTSFAQCFGAAPFGAALLAISPIATFMVCVPTRLLAGLLPAFLFKGIYKSDAPALRKNIVFFGTCLLAAVLNTVFFMGGLVLCCYNTEYIQGFVAALGASNPFMFVALFVGIQGVIEALVCCVLSGILTRVLYPIVHRVK